MKLSILDQSPIPRGKTAKEAIVETLHLVKMAESYGYHRFWLTEHHGMPTMASSAPEIILSYLGSQTNTIRLGVGAILLPHYKPFKVAEVFNTLAVLYPDRIDLGIGRAPGGSAEVTMALSDNYLDQVRRFPDKVKEINHFFDGTYPTDHMFSKIKLMPLSNHKPQRWLLGTSQKSAELAAEYGMAYAFGQFMSQEDGRKVLNHYQNHFKSSGITRPQTIVAVNVFCSESTMKAEALYRAYQLTKFKQVKGQSSHPIPSSEEIKNYSYNHEEIQYIKANKSSVIYGSPKEVKDQLEQVQSYYNSDEIMINTMTSSIEDRLKSFKLLADECL